MDRLSKHLLLELECPVCLEWMLPPITMCGNGHNICSSCKPRLENCPLCKGNFTDVKNLSLENLSRQAEVSCKHAGNGCKVMLPVNLAAQHHEECPHRLYKCPFVIADVDCPWEGFFTDIKDHIQSTHAEVGESRYVLGSYKVTLRNFGTSSKWCQAVFAVNEVFFRLSSVRDGFLYSCVFYVGPKSSARKYKYRLKIENTEGTGSVSACHETTGYQSDVNGTFKKGNCAVFHFEFAKTCVNEENELVMEEVIFDPSMPSAVQYADS